MRRNLLVSLALFAMSAGQPAPVTVPVVMELFTSEGCSSCPPADVLLTKLAKEQPIAGVQIIPLGMHVTYWDQLGWKDPASLTLATERQQAYSRVFGEDRVYTPQAVIDGRDELVGSDEAGMRKAIARAAKQPRAQVSLKASADGDSLKVEADIGAPPPDVKEPLHAWMVITEDGLSSVVKRGENGGRTLHHDAVVRAISGADVELAKPLGFHTRLRPEWRRENLHVAVVLQGKKTQRIWGAQRGAQVESRHMRGATYPLTLLGIGAILLALTAVHPYDMGTWWLEVFPIFIAVRFSPPPIAVSLTPLAYTLILVHACILMLGGHYTYARVPLGYWLQHALNFSRNPYDRIGHLAQGFVPRSSPAKSCSAARRSAQADGCSSSSAASAWRSAPATSSSSGGRRSWRRGGDRFPRHAGGRGTRSGTC